MSKTYKKVITSSLASAIIFLSGVPLTQAEEVSTQTPKVKVTVKNNLTGETKLVKALDKKISSFSALKNTSTAERSVVSTDQSVKSVVEGHEIFIPSEEIGNQKDSNSSIVASTYDTDGKTKNAGGVTARLNVAYDMGTEKIRLNKIYGSWTPSSGYYLTNRKVNAHTGQIWGYKIAKTPTTNSFSYNTGFGYNPYAGGGDISPRAWSSAISHVSGMTATYTIQIEFTFPT